MLHVLRECFMKQIKLYLLICAFACISCFMALLHIMVPSFYYRLLFYLQFCFFFPISETPVAMTSGNLTGDLVWRNWLLWSKCLLVWLASSLRLMWIPCIYEIQILFTQVLASDVNYLDEDISLKPNWCLLYSTKQNDRNELKRNYDVRITGIRGVARIGLHPHLCTYRQFPHFCASADILLT